MSLVGEVISWIVWVRKVGYDSRRRELFYGLGLYLIIWSDWTWSVQLISGLVTTSVVVRSWNGGLPPLLVQSLV